MLQCWTIIRDTGSIAQHTDQELNDCELLEPLVMTRRELLAVLGFAGLVAVTSCSTAESPPVAAPVAIITATLNDLHNGPR